MRKLNSPAETARALDDLVFEASLHALMTAVGQLEHRDGLIADPQALLPLESRGERLSR
jgi:hypothetical protein